MHVVYVVLMLCTVLKKQPHCNNRCTLPVQTLIVIVSRVSMLTSHVDRLYLSIINPRRACARVTVGVVCVCLSVCLSVYPSVPALAASASIETSKQRYSRVSLRLFLD